MRKSKIKNQKEIVDIVNTLKREKKKVVTCNGSFDVLHDGHFQFLKEAKKQGDILVILLNSDKSVKKYKGPQRPINKQDDRAQALADIIDVDYLVIFDEINPKKVLGVIKPDIHYVGRDWGRDCVEREVVEKNHGEIRVGSVWLKGLSSTAMTKKKFPDTKPTIKAVFLDRDGTINKNEPEYVHKKEDFKFLPGVLQSLKKLSQSDYKIIIVTNQSGIGRGYYTEKDLQKLHQWMLDYLKKENIRIDKIYYCPHHPKDNCSCRKPRTGMLEKAVKDFGINLSKSWIVGDDKRDIAMGKEVNLRTILLGERVKNLMEAIKIILQSN